MNTTETLEHLHNIGPVLAAELRKAGIDTPQQLLDLGAERTLLALKPADPGSCLNKLLALEGAIRGIRWHLLPKGRKEELKAFLQNI